MKKAKNIVVTMMIGSIFLWTACSTTWITQAEGIVAALIPATANLVTLVATLQGRNVSTADLQTIENAGAQAGSDLQLLESLMQQYQKADAAAQPGLLSQIGAALSAAQTTLNGLLPALHIKDATTQAKIGAVVGLLISEVQSMAAIVPLVSASSSPAMMRTSMRQSKKQAPLSAADFTTSYNATMAAKTGDVELDRATASLKIHQRTAVERWLSAGWVK